MSRARRALSTTMSADAIATALAPMVTQLVALKEENERLKSSVAPTLQRLETLEERLRSKLMWESDGRGAFGACVAARRARSVAIEGGGCIGPRRAAHKIPLALRTFTRGYCNP